MSPTVWFVDTSILCELLQVPGKCSDTGAIRRDAHERRSRGDRFVLPVTAVIETGNHVCNAAGDRRAAAERFVGLIDAVRIGEEGWALHELDWDRDFLDRLTSGSITGEPFVDLAGDGRMGAGDVAILVERERFINRGAFQDVRIWTLDGRLAAYS